MIEKSMRLHLAFFVNFLTVVAVNASKNGTSTGADAESFRFGKLAALPHIGYDGSYPRFSKIQFSANEGIRHDYLGKYDYPIQYSSKLESVQNSFCPSVTMPHDYEVKENIPEMMEYVGYPRHPFDSHGNPDLYFWDEFRFVAKLQCYRREYGETPARKIMDLPKDWHDFTINEVAEAVHDEYPGLWQGNFLAARATTKNPNGPKGPFHWELDTHIIPARCRTRFLHSIVAVAKFNTWAVDIVAPHNFCAKYYVGRIRPEEIAWKIAKGEFTQKHGVPDDVVQIVRKMKLTKMEHFSAYTEGCPHHPSYPAMHSAASSISVWLGIVCVLTEEELIQAIKTDVAVACARTVAGVHFVTDNLAGLKLGQRIIWNHIANYLEDHYGADRYKVQAKIGKVKFIWEHYLNEYCNIDLGDYDPLRSYGNSFGYDPHAYGGTRGYSGTHGHDDGPYRSLGELF